MHQELWVIRGNRPVLWTLPFRATYEDEDDPEVTPAVPLLKCQAQSAHRLFFPISRLTPKAYRISTRNLKLIGARVENTDDPEIYVSWELPRRARMADKGSGRRQERNDFLDALYQQRVGLSRDDIERFWVMFCNHALDWLINHEKPVDMYFIRIHPIPFRVDWQNKLIAARPIEGPRKHIVRRFSAYHALRKNKELIAFLSRGCMLSMSDAPSTLNRSVEIELRPSWWKITKAVETERLRRLDEDGYARAIAESVSRSVPTAIRLLYLWLTRRHEAALSIRRSSKTGRYRICASLWAQGIRAANRAYFNLDRLPGKKRVSKKDVPAKNGQLPEVPTVQPETQDLRNGGAAVSKPQVGPS